MGNPINNGSHNLFLALSSLLPTMSLHMTPRPVSFPAEVIRFIAPPRCSFQKAWISLLLMKLWDLTIIDLKIAIVYKTR